MKVRDFLKMYFDHCEFLKGLDGKTLKAYRTDLEQFFEHILTPQPEKAEIEEYLAYLHKQFRPKTVKRKVASMKAFYRYLEDNELIEDNPFRKIKVKYKETETLPRVIPKNEIEHLLNYMYTVLNQKGDQAPVSLLRDIAVIEILFATGARVSEVSRILADGIDLETGQVLLVGKRGIERLIQISDPSVLKITKLYYEENKETIQKCGFFFVNNRNRKFSEQSIRLMLKKYCKQSELERNITPHMFRHSFATYLIEEGADISFVQQILGHRSIKTTQIYVHVTAAKQAELLKKIHPRSSMNIIGAA